jgi:hypothetical protein
MSVSVASKNTYARSVKVVAEVTMTVKGSYSARHVLVFKLFLDVKEREVNVMSTVKIFATTRTTGRSKTL